MRTLATLSLFAAFIAVPLTALTFSSGAPSGRTGSPADGGATCNASGCHSGFDMNSGGGSVSITGPTSYVPGLPVDLEVRVALSTAIRFGFQISALDASNQHVGTFELVGGGNTEFASNRPVYVTHDNAVSVSSAASWPVRWRAPASGVGVVTFYATGNAANGNGSSTGDHIYSTEKMLTQGSGVATEPDPIPAHFRIGGVYPNPVSNVARLPVDLASATDVSVEIRDAMGRLVGAQAIGTLSAGPTELDLPMAGLVSGRYFVTVVAGVTRETRAVLVAR